MFTKLSKYAVWISLCSLLNLVWDMSGAAFGPGLSRNKVEKYRNQQFIKLNGQVSCSRNLGNRIDSWSAVPRSTLRPFYHERLRRSWNVGRGHNRHVCMQSQLLAVEIRTGNKQLFWRTLSFVFVALTYLRYLWYYWLINSYWVKQVVNAHSPLHNWRLNLNNNSYTSLASHSCEKSLVWKQEWEA